MPQVIAVDIGGTNQRIALVSENGITGQIRKYQTPTGPVADVITNRIISEIHSHIPADILATIRAIGISAAGPLSRAQGALLTPPNLPFDFIPLVGPIQQAFNKPVLLLNDCQAGVIAEVFAGAGVGYHNVVYITISTGIGGGIFIDGKLASGHGGNAGEIGHFLVDTSYNLQCSCGCTGHWEGYCSGRHIPVFFLAWCHHHEVIPTFTVVSSKDLFYAAEQNDPVAKAFIEEMGARNATGISQVIVAYDPAIIVLDGAVVQNNQKFIIPYIKKMVDRYLPLPVITVSPLFGQAPLLGAGIAALHPELLPDYIPDVQDET